jgi:hypothetical protein
MIRSTRLVVLATALVAALLLSPVSPTRLAAPAASAGVVAPSDMMALNLRGTAQREETQPERFQYTTDVYSLATGQRIGSATHSVRIGALVFDVTDTFRLTNGEVVSRHRGAPFPTPTTRGSSSSGSTPTAGRSFPNGGRVPTPDGPGASACRAGTTPTSSRVR